MTAPLLRWGGVMGTGWIAERFVAATKKLTQQDIAAVGSRTPDAARQFGDRFDIRRRSSYEDLVAGPDIDVVYVATPTSATSRAQSWP